MTTCAECDRQDECIAKVERGEIPECPEPGVDPHDASDEAGGETRR